MARLASFLIALKARKSAAPFEKVTHDPMAAQQTLLQRMMQRNRDTEYGRPPRLRHPLRAPAPSHGFPIAWRCGRCIHHRAGSPEMGGSAVIPKIAGHPRF
jgi:hypothetical protein